MRELMIALVVACTLIGVAEAFYRLVTPANAAVVILNGTGAATAQQPQYEVWGFPITPLQMSVLQPSTRMREQQRLSRQRTMDASRRPVYFPVSPNAGF